VRGVILAWGIGMGIIVYRSAVKEHRPPVPGQMLAATGLFALLAVIADYEPAAGAAALFGFGIDIAVLMQVLPGTTTNSKDTTAKAAAAPKAAAPVQRASTA
jgi:hypothetical protein